MFLVLRGYSGETLYQRPFVILGSLDPVDYSWDDWVLRLRFDPVEVSQVAEVLVLLYNVVVLDYHLLINMRSPSSIMFMLAISARGL